MVDGHVSPRQPMQAGSLSGPGVSAACSGLVRVSCLAGEWWTFQSPTGEQAGAFRGPGHVGIGKRLFGISRQASRQLPVKAAVPFMPGLLLAGSQSDPTADLQCMGGCVVRAPRCADVSRCAARPLAAPPLHAAAAGLLAGYQTELAAQNSMQQTWASAAATQGCCWVTQPS